MMCQISVRYCLVLAILIGIGFGLEISRGMSADTKGFDLSYCLIDKDELRSGGPNKDGIPALTNPKTVPADRVDFLRLTDQVVGIVRGGEARAYPLAVLIWHEAINDTLGDEPIVVIFWATYVQDGARSLLDLQ